MVEDVAAAAALKDADFKVTDRPAGHGCEVEHVLLHKLAIIAAKLAGPVLREVEAPGGVGDDGRSCVRLWDFDALLVGRSGGSGVLVLHERICEL